ncbi:MAG: BON domain-containing protein [Chloroflexi bacterium]|nr:BON domain-containing protein [Chloroflexota bacterium]
MSTANTPRITCPACKVRLPADSTVCPECGQNLAVLVRDARRVDVLYNEGLAASRKGDDAAGIRRLEDARTLAPQRTDILDLLARLYLRHGRRDDALAAWSHLLKIDPSNAAAQAAVKKLTADSELVQSRTRRRTGLILGGGAAAGVAIGAALMLLTNRPLPAAAPTAAAALPSAAPPPTATTVPPPTATAVPPTPTAVPPTATPAPTMTPPPTATNMPDYAARVKDALAKESRLANMGLQVKQVGEVVSLSGEVPDLALIDLANKTAQNAPGVKVVDNRITIVKAYVVQPGDTLQKIARRLYDDAKLATEIARINNITDPEKLQIGRTLKLPLLP